MNTTETPAPAMSRYLYWILEVQRQEETVRVADLAGRLGVRLPTVTRTLKRLAEAGWVDHSAYGPVTLTAEGDRIARQIETRLACLTRFLVELLGIPAGSAKRKALEIQPFMNDDLLHRLSALTALGCSSEAWLRRLRLRITPGAQPSAP